MTEDEKGQKEEKLAGDAFQGEFFSWEWEWGVMREVSGQLPYVINIEHESNGKRWFQMLPG